MVGKTSSHSSSHYAYLDLRYLKRLRHKYPLRADAISKRRASCGTPRHRRRRRVKDQQRDQALRYLRRMRTRAFCPETPLSERNVDSFSRSLREIDLIFVCRSTRHFLIYFFKCHHFSTDRNTSKSSNERADHHAMVERQSSSGTLHLCRRPTRIPPVNVFGTQGSGPSSTGEFK